MKSLQATLTATNAAVTISSDGSTSSEFAIVGLNLPVTLSAGQSILRHNSIHSECLRRGICQRGLHEQRGELTNCRRADGRGRGGGFP